MGLIEIIEKNKASNKHVDYGKAFGIVKDPHHSKRFVRTIDYRCGPRTILKSFNFYA